MRRARILQDRRGVNSDRACRRNSDVDGSCGGDGVFLVELSSERLVLWSLAQSPLSMKISKCLRLRRLGRLEKARNRYARRESLEKSLS